MEDERRRIEWPVTGWPMTQGFGDNPAAYARFGLAGHAGVDFGCPVGERVRAVKDGVVELVNVQAGGFGLFVQIDHGCFRGYYAHLHSTTVAAGDAVHALQAVGYSGGAVGDPYAGNSTGPHLHFEMRPTFGGRREFGWACDPLPYFVQQGGDMKKMKVTALWSLTVRAGPGTQYLPVRYVRRNELVTVYRMYDGWAKIGPGDEWVSGRYLAETEET